MANVMMESDSTLKTSVGRKVFNFAKSFEKCENRNVSVIGLCERIEELDMNFELMFHLKRSDFENWIDRVLKNEESVHPDRSSHQPYQP